MSELPHAVAKRELRNLLSVYRESGRSIRAEQAMAIHKRRLLAMARCVQSGRPLTPRELDHAHLSGPCSLAALIIQRYWRGWIIRKRQVVRMRHLDKVEREVGRTLDDLFAVILRNGNVAAASRDDDQRMARQKQQRKAYLFNVLRTATLTGGLRLIMADEAARAAAAAQRQRDGLESDVAGLEPAPAPSGDILPTMIRAALQMQLVQGKRVAEARAAVAPRNRKNTSASPGQLLSEVLSQVSAAERHARAVNPPT